jgi:hypothetical protein
LVCAPTSASTLPGAHIDFTNTQCSFSLSDPVAHVDFTYNVVVDQDVAGVVPQPQDAGGCGAPGPSGLIVFESVGGGGQNYCLCDTGLCAPPGGMPVTLKQGTYPATFSWDKRNWSGPSDTGNPEGPPFPVGDYTVSVSAVGSYTGAAFNVSASLPIQLVP